MPEADVLARTAGAALVLEIDRPQSRNALTPAVLAGLREAIEDAGRRPGLRVVVLRGRGNGPFSSGYDLGELPEGRTLSTAEVRALLAPVRALADAIAGCPLPVIGAARRYVIGAAFDVFAQCDIRVAEEGTRFSLPAAQLGFAYPPEGVDRLVRTLGLPLAERLLLLADRLPAEMLARTGFLHRLAPADGLDDTLGELIAHVGDLAPLAVSGLKQGLRGAGPDGARDSGAVAALYEAITRSFNSADAREGPAAVKEKRRPVFIGR